MGAALFAAIRLSSYITLSYLIVISILVATPCLTLLIMQLLSTVFSSLYHSLDLRRIIGHSFVPICKSDSPRDGVS